MIAGDWNKSDTDSAFLDFPFLQAVDTPPTQGDEVLDIVFTNMGRLITEVAVFPPLVPNAGRPGRSSDHNIVCISFELALKRNFKWQRYSYRKYTPEGDVAFGE